MHFHDMHFLKEVKNNQGKSFFSKQACSAQIIYKQLYITAKKLLK